MPNRTLVIAALVLWALVRSAAAQSPPNIVVDLRRRPRLRRRRLLRRDDSLKTPNVDRLAREGLRFTDGALAVGDLHAVALRAAHRRVRLAEARAPASCPATPR